MKQGFPSIPGIAWLSQTLPDLISVTVTLEDRKARDLGIPNLDVETVETALIIDLSKVSAIRLFHPIGSDDASNEECLIYLTGLGDIVIDTPFDSMLKAWMVYKNFLYNG